MRHFQRFLLLAVLASVTFACQKDDDNEPQINPKVRLLAKSWRTSAWTVNPPLPQSSGSPISDILAVLNAASKDDVYTFNVDKTYTIEEGPLVRTGSAKVIAKGDWFFSTDESTLAMQGNPLFLDNPLDNLIANWTIQELTETTFRVSYQFLDVDDDGNIVGTFTFTRTFVPAQ